MGFKLDGAWYLRDNETDERVRLSRRARCAACGERDQSRLVIDHDRWFRIYLKRPKRWVYRTRILCGLCNHRKGARRYVPFLDRMWVPGMRCGQTVPNPWCERKTAPLIARTISGA